MPTLYNRTLARMTRRELLNAAWKLGATAAATPMSGRGLWAQPIFPDYPFTLGVASGDPLPDGVVLWTRLAPEPLAGGGMPMMDVEVAWEIAADVGFKSIVRTGVEIARPELGHSVHAEVFGLEPGRDYWYRFHVGGEASQTGRTGTAPAADARVSRMRFGFCGCNNYEQGYFTAFRRMAEENLDFIFHSGDYIYEYRADPSRVRQHLGDEIYSIDDYRNRYAQYKTDPDLIAVHASAPFIVTWDDHEIENDWASEFAEDDTPPEVFILRRAAAFQAYYEAMPLRREQFPTPQHLQLYRGLQFGDLMTFSALDTRQYRSSQACGGGTHTGCSEAAAPDRTMLGAEQEAWLDNRLGVGGTAWNAIAQQVPIFGQDFSAREDGLQYPMDKWTGYLAARSRFLNSIDEKGLTNVVFLSGDVHSHWGADVPLDLAEPAGKSVAVEFTNTSVSSDGDGSDVRSYWPTIQGDNPHVAYHSNRRGYCICDVTPKTWWTDFMIIDRVEVPDGRLSVGGRLVVENGSSSVQRG